MLNTPKRGSGGGWNADKTVGKRKAFSEEQVQLIRATLKAQKDLRGSALFETALSAMLRSSDLLALTVDDVLDCNNEFIKRFEKRQKKVGEGVKVSLSGKAVAALRAYLFDATGTLNKPRTSLVWTEGGRTLKRLRYAQYVKEWALMAHADPSQFSTHTMRRTHASYLYKLTNDAETVRQILGHESIASTSKYLDIERDDALDIKERHEM
jgi:site-specific recombinase XerD